MDYAVSRADRPQDLKRDTLEERLRITHEALRNCAAIVSQIHLKLHGPTPETESKPVEPGPGIHNLAMELHNQASRLRDALEQINSDLA